MSCFCAPAKLGDGPKYDRLCRCPPPKCTKNGHYRASIVGTAGWILGGSRWRSGNLTLGRTAIPDNPDRHARTSEPPMRAANSHPSLDHEMGGSPYAERR